MTDLAIRVENLSKLYRIGRAQRRHDTLRDAIAAGLSSLRPGSTSQEETIWALKDVSFEVKRGEVLGVIGRNGAGKSTLLKILSRITEPTTGRAEIYGRVGSLLEVGTGFHPELTGRENIYLNGAILGMRRTEIARRFDEIIAFAEIDKFLDTPVKHYSSGMYVRLAFAVAAHLDPEILLVDEVLAVGDVAFQKKCLGKMQEAAGKGRTVLFISHSMPVVNRLCTRALLLRRGGVALAGQTHDVTGAYMGEGWQTTPERTWHNRESAPGDGTVRLRNVRVLSQDGKTTGTFDVRWPVGIEIDFEVVEAGHVVVPNAHFTNDQAIPLFVSLDSDPQWFRLPRPRGRFTSTVWIPANYLSEGGILVSVALTTLDPWRIHCHESDVVAFQVVDEMTGDSVRGDYQGNLPGVIRPSLTWVTRFQPADIQGPESEQAR